MISLVVLFPLLAFIVLAVVGSRLSRRVVSLVGVGSVGVSALLALAVGRDFLTHPTVLRQALWEWMHVDGFRVHVGLYLDSLSFVMMVVITVVSFLILLYSTAFMAEEAGYSRFFAYTNLFVSSMLVLVLADNFLLLYLGWEGVGLCSYLLIGFWYDNPENCRAANKAFIITRIGDTLLVMGIVLLFWQFKTLMIEDVVRMAPDAWGRGGSVATAVTLLLLGGAVGKSAQIPLQTWLPDAMAGPTPVSALIHAATMIAAGVYLIARTHVLFDLVPSVQFFVAIIGAVTLLLAGCAALTQYNIKKALAYSTMSQVGYMFLALGVGAWTEAIFYFMAHAFFKALLFLSAGVVIIALRHEHNMYKMGGLWRQMPLTFAAFLCGAVALAALPWVDVGFYSKDLILTSVRSEDPFVYSMSLVGSFITSLYTFRMLLLIFFGPCQQKVSYRPGLAMTIPMLVLSIGALFGGGIDIPRILGFPDHGVNFSVEVVSASFALGGLVVEWLFVWVPFKKGAALTHWWSAGWGFDWMYRRLFICPFIRFCGWNAQDPIGSIPLFLAFVCAKGQALLSLLQTGKVRWYATGLTIGAILVLSSMVWR